MRTGKRFGDHPITKVRLSRLAWPRAKGFGFHSPLSAFSLVEVLVSAAIAVMVLGIVMTGLRQGMEISKWQSSYETAHSYAQQAIEYALYIPYSDFSNTNPASSVNYVSNGMFYTTATSTNYIRTKKDNQPVTVTNTTYLATQDSLPLDDLGSFVISRTVHVTDRSVIEPTATNLNYKLIAVTNQWVFRGKTMPSVVCQVIRDAP